MRRSNRTRLFAVGVTTLALFAAGCSSDDPQDNGTGGETQGGGGTGTVPIAGSSTVGPISELVAADFGGNAAVEITGTGGGFRDRFCVGETAVQNASRAIEDEEITLCADNGVTNILELKVGVDGMAVMTSANNDVIGECLSFGELYALVGPESGDVADWADANALADEIGGRAHGTFPSAALVTAGPGTESGTYDSFIELALEGIAEEREQEPGVRPDWTGNNDDNVIIQGIIGNDTSFGWVGFAYYSEVSDQVRAFEIAGEDGTCVAPTPETIASNDYPLSRDLYIYVDLDKLDDEEYGAALEDYVDYYMSDAGNALVAEAGYVQLTEQAWAESVAAWEAKASNIG